MYTIESRVRYSECDETGKLSLVGVMNYLQDCSTFHSEDIGRGFKQLGSEGYAWVLATWQIQVDRLPLLRSGTEGTLRQDRHDPGRPRLGVRCPLSEAHSSAGSL